MSNTHSIRFLHVHPVTGERRCVECVPRDRVTEWKLVARERDLRPLRDAGEHTCQSCGEPCSAISYGTPKATA